jgi:hypothetical protein
LYNRKPEMAASRRGYPSPALKRGAFRRFLGKASDGTMMGFLFTGKGVFLMSTTPGITPEACSDKPTLTSLRLETEPTFGANA